MSLLPSLDLEHLFRLHHGNLLAKLHRLVKSEHTAEDLAQESYAKLAHHSATQSIAYPRAFLFRTATNLALDHLRKEKYRQHLPLEVAEDLPTHTPSGEQRLSHKQRAALFQHALETLSPRCRKAFLLHRLHHCSYREIGKHLGISQSGVEKLMIRALAHIRAELHLHDSQ